MKKIPIDDWFKGQHQVETNFDKKQSGTKGQMLVQLQKSYKGDSRFKLDDRFQDDIQAEKFTKEFQYINKELIELAEQDEDEPVEQLELQEEINRQLNILQNIMPEHRAFITHQKKVDKKQYNLIHSRFDPTQIDKRLFKKVETKQQIIQREKQKLSIQKGIDKKQLNLQKADVLLKKTLDEPTDEIPVQKKVKINSKAWQDLVSEDKSKVQFSISNV